jgi:hypothetical protein
MSDTMSSLVFMGLFHLAEGKRIMTTHTATTQIWHAHYTSSVQCTDGTSLPTDIHIYSPINVMSPIPIMVTISTINSIHARTHALLLTHTLPICIPHCLVHL